MSVGGEIGEVGGKNSDVHELHAYMKGYNAMLKQRGNYARGISKISVQTGTAHGGFINADGSVRKDVKIDLTTLEELSRVARKEYGLGGAVQHGASTLPPDAFDAFPRVGACEIHLATDFQNMVYEHPSFPADLKAQMYAVDPRQRDRRAKAEGYRGAVHLQGAQEGDRSVQEADVEHQRGCPSGDRTVARGALHVPDEAAEDQRHRRGRREVRQRAVAAVRSRR